MHLGSARSKRKHRARSICRQRRASGPALPTSEWVLCSSCSCRSLALLWLEATDCHAVLGGGGIIIGPIVGGSPVETASINFPSAPLGLDSEFSFDAAAADGLELARRALVLRLSDQRACRHHVGRSPDRGGMELSSFSSGSSRASGAPYSLSWTSALPKRCL